MAVVRSQAFQNARKSVGQNNYYRRKGVQLVRSKATFAPDRTFTTAQKLQQSKMAAVQYTLKTLNAQRLAPFANTNIIKRYNAATQLNRLTSNMLHGLDNVPTWQDIPAEQELTNHGITVFHPYNDGNFKIRDAYILIHENPTELTGAMPVTIAIKDEQLKFILSEAQKRYRGKKQLTVNNIGFCGVMDWRFGGTYDNAVIFAEMCQLETENETYDGYTDLYFEPQYIVTGRAYSSGEIGMSTWLFVYTGSIDNYVPTDGNAIYSTTSIYTDYQGSGEYEPYET